MKKLAFFLFFFQLLFAHHCCCVGMIYGEIGSFNSEVVFNVKTETMLIDKLNKTLNEEIPQIQIRYLTNKKASWNTGLYGLKNVRDLVELYEIKKANNVFKKNDNLTFFNQNFDYLLTKTLLLEAKQRYLFLRNENGSN